MGQRMWQSAGTSSREGSRASVENVSGCRDWYELGHCIKGIHSRNQKVPAGQVGTWIR